MTEVKRKRKIAVECDTMLWDGSEEGAKAIIEWIESYDGEATFFGRVSTYIMYKDNGINHVGPDNEPVVMDDFREPSLSIKTLEGWLSTDPGSLIVKGVKDEFWPVADGIHQRTYEDV